MHGPTYIFWADLTPFLWKGLGGDGRQWWMLRRWPWEMVSWPAANSHRQDVELQKDWLACCNTSLSVAPIAPDEGPDDHPDGYSSRGRACH
jgi:hypothetical protein